MMDTGKNRAYCFGCHWKGDPIDLYCAANNVSLNNGGLKQLADSLGISTDLDPVTRARLKKMQKEREKARALDQIMEQQLKELVVAQFHRLIELETAAERIIKTIKAPADLDRVEVVASLQNLEYIRYYLDPLTTGNPEERLKVALAVREVIF